MDAYRLYAVVPPLLKFIDSLTNWYIRFNRRRLRGDSGSDLEDSLLKQEMSQSLTVLGRVLYSLCLVMGPFAPFMAEGMYQKIRHFARNVELFEAGVASEEDQQKQLQSVHFLPFPGKASDATPPSTTSTDSEAVPLPVSPIERAFARLRTLVERVRAMRDAKSLPIKTPLRAVSVLSSQGQVLEDLRSLEGYILEELNLRELKLELLGGERQAQDIAATATGGATPASLNDDPFEYKVVPNFKSLGQRLRGDFAKVQEACKTLPKPECQSYLQTPSITIHGHLLEGDDLIITRYLPSHPDAFCDHEMCIVLDCTLDNGLVQEGIARDLVNRVQKLRKKASLVPTDDVVTVLKSTRSEMTELLKNQVDYLERMLKKVSLSVEENEQPQASPAPQALIIDQEETFEQGDVRVTLFWADNQGRQ